MPKRKTDMEKVREILRLYLDLKYSLRDTSIALGVSKTTVGEYLAEFKRTGLTYQDIASMSDTEFSELFEKSNKSSNPMYENLSKEFETMEKELKRTGVTLYLLWEEYLQRLPEGAFIERRLRVDFIKIINQQFTVEKKVADISCVAPLSHIRHRILVFELHRIPLVEFLEPGVKVGVGDTQ